MLGFIVYLFPRMKKLCLLVALAQYDRNREKHTNTSPEMLLKVSRFLVINNCLLALLQESTANEIISHFSGEKADLVVCDGAPDGL